MNRYLALAALASALMGLASTAHSNPAYDFDAGADGWMNQANEPFSVAFAPAQGFDGGGLAIGATSSRNSFQIVHAPDADWSSRPGTYAAITFDVLLDPGVHLDLAVTGLQIRDSSGTGLVFMASSALSIGSGWLRIAMSPSGLPRIPMSHDDVGISLHLGTTAPFADARIAVIDNIATSPVPEPSSFVLMLLGAFMLVAARRRGISDASQEALSS